MTPGELYSDAIKARNHGSVIGMTLVFPRGFKRPAGFPRGELLCREKVKQAERRTQEMPLPTLAKCSACPDGHDIHTVMLAPAQIGIGMPRLYCPQHEKRRNLSESYVYGRVG